MDLATDSLFGVAGFVFRQYVENEKRKHQQRMAELDAVDQSMDKAAGRGGTWIRRGIYALVALSMLSVLIAGFVGVPVVVENAVLIKGWVWGLFPDRETTEYVTVEGVLFVKENRRAFIQLLLFYLGQGIK